MNIIIGLIVGLVFFIATISAYILGLKHKAQLIKNIIPFTPIQEVVKKGIEISKHFETNKEEKNIESAVEEYWNN